MAEYGSYGTMSSSPFDHLGVTIIADTSTHTAQQRPRQQLGSACDECRRKKLRCDRRRPQCVACANSGLTCVVRDNHNPRGPKKGHLNVLRNKIAVLEARLDEQQEKESPTSNRDHADQPQSSDNDDPISDGDSVLKMPLVPWTDPTTDFSDISAWLAPTNDQQLLNANGSEGVEDSHASLMFPSLEKSTVKLQLSPVVCSDLDQLYFDRVHTFVPMLQKLRYLSWSRQPDKPKEKACLQYAVWALAASLSSQFQTIRRELYMEARRLLDALELESQGMYLKCIEKPQAWMLLSTYELISDDLQRSLVSAGRAFRLVQMMKLHEIDKHGQPTSDCDWVETESMRRTFWVAYNLDRFTSAIDRLPLTFNESEIATRLPAPEYHFISGQTIVMSFLPEIIGGTDSWRSGGASGVEISLFAESVIMSTIFGRALNLKRQPVVDYRSQEFCPRQQSLYVLLMARLQMLSMQISSTSVHPDPIVVFLAITVHMTILVLCETIESMLLSAKSQHQHQHQDNFLTGHKQRSLDAARELVTLVAVLARLNHFQTHPLTPIPLLLSARFCQSHIGLEDLYGTLIPAIASALQELTNVNGLAETCLRLLGLSLPNRYCISA